MKVTLLNEDYIKNQYLIAIKAGRKCYDSKSDSLDVHNIGEKDKQLMKNLMKSRHHSVMEHINVVFDIEDVSRALIQQASRHRIQSLSVKSTRYTLDKMLKEFKAEMLRENCICRGTILQYFKDVPYIVEVVNLIMQKLIEDCWEFNKQNNDELKYIFPEALYTTLVSTMNLRSFCNFYELRSDTHAMKEIRDLANMMFETLPAYIQELVLIYMEGSE